MGALMNVLLDIEIDLLGFACIIILCLQGPTSQKVYEITNESLKYFMKILFFCILVIQSDYHYWLDSVNSLAPGRFEQKIR